MWVKYTKTYTKKYENEDLDTAIAELLKIFDKEEHRQAQAINTHWVSNFDEVVLFSLQETTESAEEEAYKKVERLAVREAIHQLNEVQKRRVIMYFFCDMTQKAIAKTEGVSQQSVQESIEAALKKIKEIFDSAL